MDSQVCVNCRNEKPVNHTDNRLVTENCGHIKCMNCLLQEKTGCVACLSEKSPTDSTELIDPNDDFATDCTQTDIKAYESTGKELVNVQGLNKKKLETSHISVHSDGTGKKFYVCMLCKKRFQTRSQVAYHAYCNGQSKPYECLQCEEKKTFASHSHYKYHMRVHRNERTYSCDICGQGFFQMSKLRRHKLKHTQEKNFICGQCNKAFNNQHSLRKHALTHTGERPHACPACGFRFRDTSNLRKHFKKKHNGEKCSCGKCGSAGCRGRCVSPRHQCARCPQAFHSSKDLRRHAAVHTDSKPFRCKVCSKNFRRKDNLERHIRNTHPEHAPAAAVEYDETALKQITNGHNGKYETDEKTKLESLNPLPPLPLPQDLFKENNDNQIISNKIESKIDSSFIISANNARQSVIVGKKSVIEKPPESPQCEYVHKIRKANCHNISLPPIDTNKFAELDRKTNMDTLKVEEPPKDDKIFKKILCDDGDGKDSEHSVEPSPQVHWRKLKLNINWNKLLWVFPSEDNFKYLGQCLNELSCDKVLSVGCGSGLLEWMITQATGYPVTGVEVDGAWWHCKHAPPTFIPLLLTSNKLDKDIINALENTTTALLFCYFNNRPAFEEYLRHFRGNVIIIIGPDGNGVHTDPKPFDDVSREWELRSWQEVRHSKDFIAIYCKNQ